MNRRGGGRKVERMYAFEGYGWKENEEWKGLVEEGE